MSTRVLAEIVTYTPDIEILKQNILSVKNQVDEILLYDNASRNIDDFIDFAIYNRCTIVENKSNRGIAEALAYGIDYAKEKGYKYVYALDDDTISNFNCIEMLKTALQQDKQIAFIGCGNEIGLYDNFPEKTTEGIKTVRQIITAGSLIDVEGA